MNFHIEGSLKALFHIATSSG